MGKVTITNQGEFALVEYHFARNDKLLIGIEIKEGALKYCPEAFGIYYNSKKDFYRFIDDLPNNIKEFEIRREILIAILKKENKPWENIKWEVDPETYLDKIL